MSQNLDQTNAQISQEETVEKQNSKYCTLNLQNQNLLYNHIYNEHKFKKFIFAFFVLVIVINFFCNLSLLIANFQTQEVIEEYYYLPFHQLDFWGAFLFALSEGCVLILTGIVTLDSYKIYLIIINIGGTLIALILFLFNPEFFEPASHWIEYSVQLLLTLTDFLFIFQQDKTSLMYKYRYCESFIIIVTFIMAFIKLFIYGNIIPTNDDGERQAHYLEYSGEMINDCFVIFFIVLQLNQENTNILETMQMQLDKLLELNGITIRQ
ncbi:unnamed protein product [Paramecium primaurelia]|uniref:Transmembrane protein n=1 Tax=Paramecium primaurelia TaxID=5886 RepID=A0A8S1JZN7_PARPR|nr:unnamed protein product [Paramecium primaurelia]